jgi:hypothetical protein
MIFSGIGIARSPYAGHGHLKGGGIKAMKKKLVVAVVAIAAVLFCNGVATSSDENDAPLLDDVVADCESVPPNSPWAQTCGKVVRCGWLQRVFSSGGGVLLF